MIVAVAPGRGLVRMLRAALLAAVAVGAGSLAHALGGGCLTVAPVLGLWLTVTAASWVLAATELTGPVLLGWLALTQIVVHGVLQAACPHEGAPGHRSAAMTAAHLAGLALAAAALRMGEAGLWASRRLAVAVRRLRRLLSALISFRVLSPVRRGVLPATARKAFGRGVAAVALGGRGRRGPPVGLVFRLTMRSV